MYVKLKLMKCSIHINRTYMLRKDNKPCYNFECASMFKILLKILEIFGRSWGKNVCLMAKFGVQRVKGCKCKTSMIIWDLRSHMKLTSTSNN